MDTPDEEVELFVEPPEITNWQRSHTVGQLTKAMARAHLHFETLKKERENPFYHSKYADLNAGIDASLKAISEQECCVFQLPIVRDGKAGVHTLLVHSSDEWISCDLLLKMIRDDPQGAGGTITFARRYAREAILDMSGEIDDDANLASGKPQEKKLPVPPPQAKPKTERTPGQKFWATARATGHSDKEIEEYIKTIAPSGSAKDIPEDKRDEAMKWAEQAQGLPWEEVTGDAKS